MANKICPNCGNELAEGTMFCDNCGARLVDEDATVSAVPAAETPAPEAAPVQEAAPAPEAALAPEAAPASGAASALNSVKDLLTKKNICIAAAAVAALVLIIILFSAIGGGSYKTPGQTMIDVAAGKISNPESMVYEMLNGLTEKEMKKVIKCFSKTDLYKDFVDEQKEEIEESQEYLKEEYGKNFKIKLEIEEKEELKKKEIKSKVDEIEYAYKNLDSIIDRLKKYDSDDWEDKFGISKSQGKELIDALKALEKAGSKLDGSAGYSIEYAITIKGSEDEDENNSDFVVVKVNGKWVNAELVYSALQYINDYIRYCN